MLLSLSTVSANFMYVSTIGMLSGMHITKGVPLSDMREMSSRMGTSKLFFMPNLSTRLAV